MIYSTFYYPKKLCLDVLIKHGFYVVKLFKDNTIYFIIIDDKLAVNEFNQLLFCHCNNINELWPCYIEKAYAKLYGTYCNLIGGSIVDGIVSTSKYLCNKIQLKDPNILYRDIIEMFLIENSIMGCIIKPECIIIFIQIMILKDLIYKD